MRAAVYARISHDPDDDGLGVERQREDCLALVDREGWELVDVYTDNARSAYNGAERPAWRELLEACVEGRVDVVVAYRDDRLWRDVVEERQVSAMLAEEDVERIAFANGRSYDPADVDDQLTSGIHALVAEHESAVKAVRVKRALEQRAAEGRYPGGPTPYGYRRPEDGEVEAGVCEPGGLLVVEAEAEVVREAARRVLAGEDLTGIARDFNDRDVPTATEGTDWYGTRLREVLENPVYAGLLRFRGEVVGEGRWAPILDRSTHEALAATFDGRRRSPGRPPTRLLTGILRCHQCGHGMRGTTHKGKNRYQCRSGTQSDSCGGPSISGDPTDDYVAGQLLAVLADSEALAARLSTAAEIDLGEVTDQLSADETRLEELVADYYTGDVPKRAYLKARERLEDRIAQARGRLAEATSSAADVPVGDLDALEAWWEAASVSQRRNLLEVVVDHVELKPWKPSMGRQWSEDRVDVVWRA